MNPSFEPVERDTGIAVVDSIERHRYALTTPEAVAPTVADTDRFRFPVDAAVSIHTAALSLPSVVSVHLRDESGTIVAQAEHFANEELPHGEYTIELSAPIKLYCRVESTVTVTADVEGMTIEFDDATEVVVGARSHHERPAATVTTTTDPEDMMAAISTFGSALKTTSPERSYPTLRGHPPTVELGDELDLAGLEPPDTGVTIEVPPECRSIFVVAPLAYYLGARVRPGDEPRLRTDRGLDHSLDGPCGFERTVERTLKGTFFLDCLARTEGLYPVALHEREAVEANIDLDLAALYDRPIAERLDAYLDVPFAAVEDHLPEWKLTSHVEPAPTSVETLPFLVDDLAVVRCASTESVARSTTLTFDGGVEAASAGREDAFTRSASTTRSTGSSVGPGIDTEFVSPEATDSLEAAWVGEGLPLGASKTSVEAYRNRLDRTPADGDIDITVVCNDAEMAEERDLIEDVYGDRDELPFDVSLHRDLTTAELEGLLSTRTDFLHYIGHVDEGGFECVDGELDANTLDTVGVDAFLLNACQSYRQGMALLDAGAIGGIATLTDVLNCEAVRMGRTLAALLNAGFPLQSALNIARGESIMGNEYLVVGDGGLTIAQPAGAYPNLLNIERNGDTFYVEMKTYPSTRGEIGGLVIPCMEDDKYYLSPGSLPSFDLSYDELQEFLSLENVPVKTSGRLSWATELDVDEIS
ncbi:hypothetical protein [Halococcus agarilyticus]|uniref:hypothetical protein n=1 Tax=Halococcus agarilyticus TaxID=1232219 RepID=UPI000678126C|nr:hypothetical protein [Halococcus agarilyticus]